MNCNIRNSIIYHQIDLYCENKLLALTLVCCNNRIYWIIVDKYGFIYFYTYENCGLHQILTLSHQRSIRFNSRLSAFNNNAINDSIDELKAFIIENNARVLTGLKGPLGMRIEIVEILVSDES